MCVVSMVTDHYRDKWPLPQYPSPGAPFIPSQPSQPFQLLPHLITKEQWDEYQELKRKAVEYDKRTNQPDCAKPEVEEWERAIESVLRKHGILK
jgi:hypothetical protein